jgi:hypothetical protein
MEKVALCDEFEKLRALLDEWWFDDTYLLHDLRPIVTAMDIIKQYEALPRGRGSAYLTERWLNETDALSIVNEGMRAVDVLIGESGNEQV